MEIQLEIKSMNKTLVATSVALGLALSGSVLAGGSDNMAAAPAASNNMSVGFNLGMMTTHVKDKDTASSGINNFGMSAGMNFGGGLAANVSYQNYSMPGQVGIIQNIGNTSIVETTSPTYMTLTANGTYSLPLSSKVFGLVGAGIGWGHMFHASDMTDGNNAFVYQFMAGFGYNVTSTMNMTASYTYVGSAGDKGKNSFGSDRNLNVFGLGMNFSF